MVKIWVPDLAKTPGARQDAEIAELQVHASSHKAHVRWLPSRKIVEEMLTNTSPGRAAILQELLAAKVDLVAALCALEAHGRRLPEVE